MMIGIIGAMEIETRGIKELMEACETSTYASMEFVKGKIAGKEVVCAMCNPGKVNAALCAQTMILKFNPEIIINSGVAGSLTDELDVLGIAIGESCVQHDFDLSPLGCPVGLVDGVDTIYFECDKKAIGILKEICGNENVKSGVIATGDVFVSGDETKERIKKEFGAIACEMEGGAIAHVCKVNDVRFAALRTISDGANEMDFNTFKYKASELSIDIMKKFVEKY